MLLLDLSLTFRCKNLQPVDKSSSFSFASLQIIQQESIPYDPHSINYAMLPYHPIGLRDVLSR